jgi:hypothetical protein
MGRAKCLGTQRGRIAQDFHEAIGAGGLDVAISGSAPAEVSVAVIAYEGMEHRVPVDDGVFALMLRASIEPKPTLTRPQFE